MWQMETTISIAWCLPWCECYDQADAGWCGAYVCAYGAKQESNLQSELPASYPTVSDLPARVMRRTSLDDARVTMDEDGYSTLKRLLLEVNISLCFLHWLYQVFCSLLWVIQIKIEERREHKSKKERQWVSNCLCDDDDDDDDTFRWITTNLYVCKWALLLWAPRIINPASDDVYPSISSRSNPAAWGFVLHMKEVEIDQGYVYGTALMRTTENGYLLIKL